MPAKKKSPPKPELHDVAELGRNKGMKPHEIAGLTVAKGWAPGRQVSEEEFDAALEAFRNRRQGGGRI